MVYLLTENIIQKIHVGRQRKMRREGKMEKDGDRWTEGGGEGCMTLCDALKLKEDRRWMGVWSEGGKEIRGWDRRRNR